jgi:hypothetical protein
MASVFPVSTANKAQHDESFSPKAKSALSLRAKPAKSLKIGDFGGITEGL